MRIEQPAAPFNPKPTDPKELDAELSPADFNLVHLPPKEEEADAVRLVNKHFKSASSAKSSREREWLVDIAFENGNQWVEYREDTGLRSLRNEADPKRTYVTCPLIRPIITKLKARATMSKPDASVSPKSQRPVDVQAAPEARDVLAHYDRKFDRQYQTLMWVDSVLTMSTTCLKPVWDFTARCDVPVQSIGADTAGGYQRDDVGDIDEAIVPPFELFPDPSARTWKDVKWIIHARKRPLSYFQSKYGKRGYDVKADSAGSESYDYVDVRVDSIMGQTARNAAEQNKLATLLEYWELPSPLYKKGRRIDIAGNVLLLYMDLPYDYAIQYNELPFIPLTMTRKTTSLWSPNAVHDLVELNYNLNCALSRIQDRVNNETTIIIEEEGSETGAENPYISPYSMSRVKHRQGSPPPTVMNPSPVNESLFKVIETYKGMMEDVSGVHEVSNGAAPPGVTAGNAIELLQQSDQTQMSEFVTCIEQAQKKRAEWEIALVAQFYKEDRLVDVAVDGDPNKVAGQVKSFEALRNGGRVTVDVTPGSATPKTPAARNQMIMDMSKAGMLQPQNLASTAIMVKLMSIERSDELSDQIQALADKVQASQPDPAVAAQEQQRAQQQHEAEMLANQVRAEIEKATAIDNVQAANKIKVAQATAGFQAQAKAALSAQDHDESLAQQMHDHHHDAAMLEAEAAMPVVPSVSLAPIPVTPETAIDAAKAAGYSAGSVADIKKQQAAAMAPKPTATNTPKK